MMLNSAVLICTHQRVEITIKNIESLLRQSVVPEIILVCSSYQERMQFREKFQNIYIEQWPNMPLGEKFQRGVDIARVMKANPLIINGSDDILGLDFIELACASVSDGVDFIGLYHWHILHQKVLYHFKYNARLPLGGGRVFSKRALDALKWKLFDTSRNKHLDDMAFANISKQTTLDKVFPDYLNDRGFNIISIKGDWETMNSFERIMKSKNCTLLSKTILPEELSKITDYQ